jgi:transmembrane sensor
MTEMRFPLKDHLQDPVDEAAIHRVALAIDERLEGRKRRRLKPLLLVGAAAAAAAFVLASLHARRDPGPLLLTAGGEITMVEAATTGHAVDLSDGSRILLSPGSRIEPVHSTSNSFSAIVAKGRADFEVRPGGPRRWTLECGLATVEVVGTSFSIDRQPGRLRVAVRHGVVLVRSEHIADRVRRLAAGEALEVSDEATAAQATPEETPHDTAEPERPAAVAVRPESQHVTKRPLVEKSWRDLARNGQAREAFATLGSEGLRRESERLGVNDLLALADVARLSGHPAEAVMPLERILSEFSSDSQSPLAAFALGRLELDSLGRARAAVIAFRRAIELGIPSSLREDVRARLVEACARSGDVRAARRAADEYRAEFPEGRHARAIEGWLNR